MPAFKKDVSVLTPVVEIVSQEDTDQYEDCYEDEETDLFFCCADWESQVKLAQQDEEIQCSAPTNRRQTKALEKMFNSDTSAKEMEFDVDLVMEKPCPNTCSRLLGKRKFLQPKSKHTSPSSYKMQKALSVCPILSSFDDQSAPRES
jgi:hypothetical protein